MAEKVSLSGIDPNIQGSGIVSQGVQQEEEASIFVEDENMRAAETNTSEKDKVLVREVNGDENRKIRVGRDADGKKYRYTDDTHEELVAKTTTGENTYLTKSEFDRQVREILKVEQLPKGIKAEFREGCIVFINEDTGLTMSAKELQTDERILAARNKIDIKPISIEELSLAQGTNINQSEIKLDMKVDRETMIKVLKENPNEYLAILAELYKDKKELQKLVRTKFDISKPSGATAEDIDKRLAEVHSPMRNMGQLFIDAEKKYGVNAWVLLGVVGIESSYGRNKADGTTGNFVGIKHKNSNRHRELKGRNSKDTYRNNVNAVAYQLHLYNTRGLKSPYEVATRYCNLNKGAWSNFISDEIIRGQGFGAKQPDESTLAQLREEQLQQTKNIASVKPFDEPPIEDIQKEYTNLIQEVTVKGSLKKVNKGNSSTKTENHLSNSES